MIGTEFGDDFVITDRGVLGAGLFVRYAGLEKVVVDALEGNDTFFIQSTAESVAVEVVGGLGSDTFHAGGGNNGEAITVVANDLLGHSGLVVNQVASTDTRYQGVFAQDISVNVADNDEAGVVVTLVDGPIQVFENEAMAVLYDKARYAIVLSRSPEEAVQVTAVPTLPKRSERQGGGYGVSLNGKFDGVTLLFDRSNWFIPQYITVAATAPEPEFLDELAEGPRDVLIQHSVQQGGNADDGGAYDKINVPTVVANVVDDDSAGVVVITEGVGGVVAESGQSFSSYSYHVALTREPLSEIVVDIVHDDQVVTGVTQLVFNSQNWHSAQPVTVTAAADPTDPSAQNSKGSTTRGFLIRSTAWMRAIRRQSSMHSLRCRSMMRRPGWPRRSLGTTARDSRWKWIRPIRT